MDHRRFGHNIPAPMHAQCIYTHTMHKSIHTIIYTILASLTSSTTFRRFVQYPQYPCLVLVTTTTHSTASNKHNFDTGLSYVPDTVFTSTERTKSSDPGCAFITSPSGH
jgi:hypothetical protein